MTYPSSSPKVRIEFVALLAACALFLSTVEYLIPKPVPFMRIGLANLPLIIGLGLLTKREYILLALLKVLGQGLITGTIFSYIILFSIAGTFASTLLMYIVYRFFKQWVSLIGVSIAGAMASNVAQLTLSQYLLFGAAAKLIAPPFLVVGLISSIILGVFAQQFEQNSAWYRSLRKGSL
ncbi:MAG: Gx transporter family protein [Sphaerochaetaceae bacterium]|nr:Gx transporter family protein [Sphaerochaetaceae bacterium]